MSIVTGTGDRGQTGLFGGQRTAKSDTRIHAYGTVDELNAVLGVILSEPGLSETLRFQLLTTQKTLFALGSDLATPKLELLKDKRINADHVAELDRWIEALELALPPLTHFILPSGSRVGSLLHEARTVARRAERWAVALAETDAEHSNPLAIQYLNRLSDYLFCAARQANRDAGAEEVQV